MSVPEVTTPAAVVPAAVAPVVPEVPAAVTPVVPPVTPSATEVKPAVPPVVPQTYDLKVPDGSSLDATRVEEITALAKEQNLTNAQAQRLLDREHQRETSNVEHLASVQAGWLEAVKNDKELGGEFLKETAEHSKRFLDRFASPVLIADLELTKYGNHPELLRMLAKAGKAMAPDQLVRPGSNPGNELPLEQRFYPNMNKEK